MSKGSTERTYVGIDNNQFGDMTALSGLVKVALIFGLLPESQTCEGWTHAAMEALGEKVRREWQK